MVIGGTSGSGGPLILGKEDDVLSRVKIDEKCIVSQYISFLYGISDGGFLIGERANTSMVLLFSFNVRPQSLGNLVVIRVYKRRNYSH